MLFHPTTDSPSPLVSVAPLTTILSDGDPTRVAAESLLRDDSRLVRTPDTLMAGVVAEDHSLAGGISSGRRRFMFVLSFVDG